MQSSSGNKKGKVPLPLLLTVVLLCISTASYQIWQFQKQEADHQQRYDAAMARARDVLNKLQEKLGNGVNSASPSSAVAPYSQSSNSNYASATLRTQNQPVESHAKEYVLAKSNSRDIVIGMAQDTDPKNLVVFCASLRKHSSADVVLFANSPVSDLNLEIASKYNINLIPFSLSEFPVAHQAYHPSTLRWTMIYNFFQVDANRKKYQRVWMIDVRDSMFQSDPFAILPVDGSAFYAFKGVETKVISQCGWNGGWVRDCFGESMVKTVGLKPIICSGVSVGTIDTVLPYIEQMYTITSGKDTSAKFPMCERNGVDQGVHNVLVHTGRVPNLHIWGQSDSPVLNLQAKVARVEGMTVHNKKGELAAVVHQYDRYPDLQKALFKEYVYWIDTSDPLAEWNADKQCAQFHYVPDKDLFKGKCDFRVRGGATGPSSCCSICSSFPECSAFTFYGGQCFLKSGCKKPPGGPNSRLVIKGAVSAYLK
mmetsp:Transcript_26200/g.38816  ORF Transcript_26200/g.38816 Transcript_26200/m.38816 type:complete len:481 (+) Transcript_26200:100-1542(+)